MFALRRTTGRVLSLSPSTVLATKNRTFTSFRVPIPSVSSSLRLSLPPIQRRFASEGYVPQTETEYENNSNAAAAEEIQDTEPLELERERSATSSKGVVNEAASSIVGTAAAVGETLSGFTRQSSDETRAAPPSQPSTTIFVGNLVFEVTDADLQELFQQSGTVTEAKVITSVRGGSRGFGYVTFENVEAATKAIEAFDQQRYEGRRLTVEYSSYKPRNRLDRPISDRPLHQAQHEPTRTLFIGNLSFDLTDRDLNVLFREVEGVTDVRVAIDRRTGQPRGFAHADFVDQASAERAMGELRGKIVGGRALRLDYSVKNATDYRRSNEGLS